MRSTTIRESRSIAGRFRGGKLAPVMAVGFKSNEGGMLSQTAIVELDPVAGRLITPVTGQMFAVYVPVQAMAALKNPTDPNAGITEVLRMQGLEGLPLFGVEAEGDLSKRMGVMPMSQGGVKMVGEYNRLAHNCAVNFLRKRVYTYAAQLLASNTAMTPALLSSTVLDRFNAVLNPDDHINGMVGLDITSQIPVYGITRKGGGNTTQVTVGKGGDGSSYVGDPGDSLNFAIDMNGPIGEGIYAKMTDSTNAGISLTELYNAEVMDRLTRQMRSVIDANPIDGEEQVLRWAHGLNVDVGQNCFLLHGAEVVFGQDMLKAMDGAGIEAEVTQSRLAQQMRFTVPVPRTELGGVVVTFLTVKPDEVVAEQPHPVLSKPWVFDNLMAEELQNDPVAVTAREIQADIAAGSEATVVFYTGYNELRRTYVNYGWNRLVDPETVDAKNAMWLYEIPASVTPENIIYPADISHYPFLDEEAEVARYQVTSILSGMSPIFIGPSPVETVAIIDTEDLFEGADQ